MPSSADKLMDEVLLMTVLQKDWDFKRIADFAIDKQIEILQELQKKFEHPDISKMILQLLETGEQIRKIKS